MNGKWQNRHVQVQEDNYFLKRKVTWVWILFSIFVLTIFIYMIDFRFTLCLLNHSIVCGQKGVSCRMPLDMKNTE